ncbi:GMP synthase (glutamine-hydrolyzing) [Marinobacterium sp. MBR-111]|uniref:type 1 glutamine amidotransferase n=1 Tax=Marinobacterium sp. MBR-111 TaxID=3156463 RepID=UPI0033998B05
MKAKTAIAIVHDRNDVLGCLPELLTELNISLSVIAVTDTLPAPQDADIFFVMGSPESAHDNSLPWIEKELSWLRMMLASAKPLFGICFGSQIIARAMGGKALALPEPEIGFVDVKANDGQWRHPGPWLDFHFDTFALPEDACLMGITELAPQSYRRGNCWAVQFHPEINVEMFDTWVAYWKKSATGQAFLQKSADLVAEMRREIASNETTCRDNFRNLLQDFLASVISCT